MVTCRSIRAAIFFPACIIFLLVFIVVAFTARVCRSSELLIGTGNVDSFSYFAGKAICSSVKRYDKSVTCRPVPSEEYADSLTNMQSGSLDMALVSSKMLYDAVHGAGLFQYINIQYDDLRPLMVFYREPISLVARRDAEISSFGDLAGKRVNGGAFYSRQNQVFGELMALKNWNKGDFLLYQNLSSTNAQGALALKSGSVQAMLHIGMHPDNSLKQILVQGRSKMIGLNDADVNRLVDSKVGYCRCAIDAGTYPGLTSDLKTMGTETILITSADTADETVELVLNATTEAKAQLQNVHPSFMQNSMGIETLDDSSLELHPAAILFFKSSRNRQ